MKCAATGFVVVAAVCLGLGSATTVTPVEKVTTLLEDLIAEVEAEGKSDAEAYDTFACFCKDTSGEKSEGITTGKTDIEEQSALVAEKDALINTLNDEIAALQAEIADLETKMAERAAAEEARKGSPRGRPTSR